MRRVLVPLLAVLAAWPLAAQRYPEAEEEGHVTGADGVRLFYRKLGNGKDVVVMLHGGPGGTMRNGEEMAPLAKGRTLIFYDQRGGGRSELLSDAKLLTSNHHLRPRGLAGAFSPGADVPAGYLMGVWAGGALRR
jgi:pimeloyl-ACP methyl ester carboxylesterase